MSENSFANNTFITNKYTDVIHRSALMASLLLPFSLIIRDQIAIMGAGIEKYAFGIVVLLWLVSTLRRGYVRKPTTYHVLTSVLVIWSLCSILWSLNQQRTASVFINNGVILVLSFVLWDLYRTKAQHRLAGLSYTLTSLVISVGIALNFLLQSPYGRSVGRFSVLGVNPNNIALAILLSIPISWKLLHEDTTSDALRWLLGLQLVLVPIAVLLTGSRQALVGLVLVATYPIWTLVSDEDFSLPDWRILAGFSFIGILFVVLSENVLKRFLTIPAEILGGDFGSRLVQWKAGWSVFVHHPVLGIGAKAFNAVITPIIGYSVATDNTYLQMLYGLGIIGLGIFLALLMYLFYIDRVNADDIYGPWTVILVVWCVIAGVNDLIWVPFYWFLFTWFVAEHRAVEYVHFGRYIPGWTDEST